jgi:arylformamidase
MAFWVETSNIIDITQRITVDMPVWPGDPSPALEAVTTLAQHGVQVSRLVLGTHTGTHLDAPRHFIPGGRTIDQLDLEVLLGPCCVLEVQSADRHIAREDLEDFDLQDGARVLLKTRNSHQPPTPTFRTGFSALEASAADYLRERRVRLVGIDGPSVDAWTAADFPCHRCLLKADILILENLELRHVAPGIYGLIGLPLNLADADGCPMRALLTPVRSLSEEHV